MSDLKTQDSLMLRNCVRELGELFPVHISAFDLFCSPGQMT